MKNKYTLRIPTVQFGYIETVFEGTAEDAFAEHDKLVRIAHGTSGISTSEFNDAIDEYLGNGTGNTETYLRMSKEQQMIIQEIKKSTKRLNK